MSGRVGCKHSVLLDDVGAVWTVGSNSMGQLGHGEDVESLAELSRVEGLPPCAMVQGGYTFTACVTMSGDLYCFGEGNQGQLGQGNTETLYTPHKVNGLPPIASVACGDHFTICVGRDSSVWAFGYNLYGQLGLGHTDDVNVPTRVDLHAAYVACGAEHTLFLGLDGRLWSCGKGFSTRTNIPTHIPLDVEVESVHCGLHFSLIKARDGSVWLQGSDTVGQLGGGVAGEQFQQIPDLVVTSVACGYQHVVALDHEGCLWGWGSGSYGQLGPRKKYKNARPTILMENVQGMVTGYYNTYIRTSENQIVVCGYNEYGQLSLGHHRFSFSAFTPSPTIPEETVPRLTRRYAKSAMSSIPPDP